MLMDKLREGAQGRIAKIIFWLIILSFSLAGIGSYLNRPADTNPAKVNDQSITSQDFDRAYQNERNRMEQQFGESFSQLVNNPEYVKQLRKGVLERMVNQIAVDQQAITAKIRIGDEQIKSAIRAMPEFQKDGQFDNERYLNLLSRAGMTPQSFSASIRQQLLRDTWVGGLTNSEFVLPGEVNVIDGLLQQSRDVTLYTLPIAHFQKSVAVSEDEIAAYYKAHQQQFKSQDRVNVSYIELNAAALASQVKVNDQDAQAYYDQHQDQYKTAERRQVAHILISAKGEDAAAEKQANDLLTQIKGGADFAELAKTKSADVLSARKGGELDWFEKGVMDPAFEKAAFALTKTGELSAVVKSQFGYHIIKLLGVQPETQRPFADVKADVLARLQQDKSHELFLDKQQKMADSAFENPDSLDGVAEQLGVKVQQSGLFAANEAKAPFTDAKLRQQAFNETLREQNTNSEVIAVGDDKAYVLHVTDFKPAAVRPLQEVRADVESAVRLDKAQSEAVKQAQALLASMQKGEDVTAQLTALDGTKQDKHAVVRTGNDLDPQLLQALFRMPHPADKDVVRHLVSKPDGEQVILVLTAVNASDKPSANHAMLTSQMAQSRASGVQQALLEQARASVKIQYNPRFDQQVSND